MHDLIERAKAYGPIRLAVVAAGQGLVLEGLQQANALGLAEPCLIGRAQEIAAIANQYGWDPRAACIASVDNDSEAASVGAHLVREGSVDAIMKGDIHTDVLMRALLHQTDGLRISGRRASHVLVVDVPSHTKLLCVTDAAVNIAPDLDAKAQILQNAIDAMRMIGIDKPKAAVLSAVETVNPAIASTLDAAALTLMSRRGQILGAVVDGPLAFDAIFSADAAREKDIESEVAGAADIILVPDLVSGNLLAKALEYLAGAKLAGVVVGLAAPVILTSRADPAPARLSSIALAILLRKAATTPTDTVAGRKPEVAAHMAPQPEAACGPLPA